MRIAVIHSNADYLVGLRLPLLRRLKDSGFSVFALAPNFRERHRATLGNLGIEPVDFRLRPTGMNPAADFRDMIQLSAVLRRLRLDAVLTNTIKPVIYGTGAAALAGVPSRHSLISGLGYAFIDDGRRASPRKWLVRMITSLLYSCALRLNASVIFQNSDDAHLFVRGGICPSNKAHVVAGSGVDVERFSFATRDCDSPVYAMVARLLVEKGVRNYLDAARIVKQKIPSARFLLIGGRDANPSAIGAPEVEAVVAEGVVEWIDHVDDVRPWLYQANVFVLPSYREGVPRSTLEAMATGLPVISTDVPGCRETVIEGVNGVLVPVRDTESLARAMLELASDPDRRRVMGAESRALVTRRFDSVQVNDDMFRCMGLQPLSREAE